jgi:hypothetical protein
MEITLRASNGKFVHQTTFPPFETQPVVVLWGSRVFARDFTIEEAIEYKECFFYAVI